MTIVPMTERYVDDLVADFADFYSDKERYTNATSQQYLDRAFHLHPQYCFAAVHKGKCIGGLFCRLDPYYHGQYVFIDILHVIKSQRRQGVGKKLLEKAFSLTRKGKFLGVHMLIDGKSLFPKNWYKRLGFTPTGWVEYDITVKKLPKNI